MCSSVGSFMSIACVCVSLLSCIHNHNLHFTMILAAKQASKNSMAKAKLKVMKTSFGPPSKR